MFLGPCPSVARCSNVYRCFEHWNMDSERRRQHLQTNMKVLRVASSPVSWMCHTDVAWGRLLLQGVRGPNTLELPQVPPINCSHVVDLEDALAASRTLRVPLQQLAHLLFPWAGLRAFMPLNARPGIVRGLSPRARTCPTLRGGIPSQRVLTEADSSSRVRMVPHKALDPWALHP